MHGFGGNIFARCFSVLFALYIGLLKKYRKINPSCTFFWGVANKYRDPLSKQLRSFGCIPKLHSPVTLSHHKKLCAFENIKNNRPAFLQAD